MAWTAPRTWVLNEVVDASTMNTHVRDNLLESPTAKVTGKGVLTPGTAANAVAALAAGSNFFAPIYHSGESTGLFTKAVPIILFSDATEISTASSTTETDIFSITLPANWLTTKNWLEILFMDSQYNNTGSDRIITRKVYYGSASHAWAPTSTSGGTIVNTWWHWFIRAAGGTSAQTLHMYFEYIPSSGVAGMGGMYEYTTGFTVDATQPQTLRLSVQNNFSSSALWSKSRIAMVTFHGTTQ